MGHTESISDYALECAATRGPQVEGVDIDLPASKSNAPKQHMSEGEVRMAGDDVMTTSKVIEGEDKAPAKKSTARTKSK